MAQARSQEDVQKFFEAQARNYEDRLGHCTADAAELTVKHVPIPPGERIYDGACGTGLVTRAILAKTTDVHIDASDYSKVTVDIMSGIVEQNG